MLFLGLIWLSYPLDTVILHARATSA